MVDDNCCVECPDSLFGLSVTAWQPPCLNILLKSQWVQFVYRTESWNMPNCDLPILFCLLHAARPLPDIYYSNPYNYIWMFMISLTHSSTFTWNSWIAYSGQVRAVWINQIQEDHFVCSPIDKISKRTHRTSLILGIHESSASMSCELRPLWHTQSENVALYPQHLY